MQQDLLSYMFGAPRVSDAERERQLRLAQAAALRGQEQQGVQPASPPQFPQPLPPEAVQPPMQQAPVRPPARPVAPAQQQGGPMPLAPPPEAPAADPNAFYEQRQQDLYRQMQTAMQPPDMSSAQDAYRRRTEGGGHALALALGAQMAGEGFEPFQASHLKQAAAAREPMKMAGGTMTETGFIEDPTHGQEFKVRQLQAQMAANDRIIAANAAREEKIAAEKRNADLRRELQASQQSFAGAMASNASADRRYAADLAHTDRAAALESKGAGNPSEGERKAATLLQRLEFSQKQLTNAAGEQPGAADPSLWVKGLQSVPRVGDMLGNYAMTPERQRVEAAQLDILDSALTLGTGAAYTREQLQGYRRSYFPEPGDDAKTKADKAARLDNVIDAAYTQAGRSAPERGATAAKVPQPTSPSMPAAPQRPAAAPSAPSAGGRRREDILKQYGVQ